MLVSAALLVFGGSAAAGYYLLSQDRALRGGDPAVTALGLPGGTAAPTTSRPVPRSSTDPRFVEVGQCVKHEGQTGGKPQFVIAPCEPKTYEVLHRVNGETTGGRDAEAKCAEVKGYTNWYFFDSEFDALDFVLCLKVR